MRLHPGRTLGPYEVVTEIRRGGMVAHRVRLALG